jgi:ubiquitin carboxyl-terminal hydrolase 10
VDKAPVLIVSLKRYNSQNQKLTDQVIIPEELDLTKHVIHSSNNLKYKLKAAVLHHGSSASAGHYTTIIKGTSNYIIADDSIVTATSTLPRNIHTNGYIFLYHLQGTTLDIKDQ